MEKVMNCYETTFIVDTSKGDAVVDATVEKFCGLVAANAEVVDIDKWGKRRLAYAINDLTEGYYTVVTFKCDGAFCAELDFEPAKKATSTEAPAEAEEVSAEAPAETPAE